VISWLAPFDQGSPLTSYKVEIRQSDNVTYSLELTNCDASQSKYLTDPDPKICLVPVTVLISAPFNLPWGSPVFAIVTAFNAYGSSLVSNPGSGGRIITYPDAPIQV